MMQSAMWLVTALSLAGNVGVVQRRRWGWCCWIVANTAWAICYAVLQIWPSAALFTAYLALAIWGWKETK